MFVIATSGNFTFLYIMDHFPSSFQNETSCFSVLKLAEQLFILLFKTRDTHTNKNIQKCKPYARNIRKLRTNKNAQFQ